MSQMVGCSLLHEAEARLARWLLMAQDRTLSDVLNLTYRIHVIELSGQQRDLKDARLADAVRLANLGQAKTHS